LYTQTDFLFFLAFMQENKPIHPEYGDTPAPNAATLTRWRLMLGGGEADGTGEQLSGKDGEIDAALDALYEYERRRRFSYSGTEGGGGRSTPAIARWLGDIRKYFPGPVVEIMQKDAMSRPSLRQKMLLEPEILESAIPDVQLVATLLELKHLMPDQTRETGKKVVQKVVDELMERIKTKFEQTISGALHRQARKRNPRFSEIDWHTTIKKNLKHYQPKYKTIIPEVKIGYGRKNRKAIKDILLCLDQSGSMGTSVVYSGIFGAVLASLPGVRTRLVAFDTEIADLSAHLNDPVDLLFGVQLGGGTDINNALSYCQSLITQPSETILVVLSDLFEGGDSDGMRERCVQLSESGVQVVVLLALSDDGAPAFDRENARFLAEINIPVFACTPDVFPDLMAAAIEQRDLKQWAGEQNIVLKS
jgi:Mg-chelatase subunit ChlD